MSFYRSLLAALAALAFCVPAFAADEANAAASDQQAPQQLAQAANPSTDASQQQTKLDLNKASVKELAKLKGLSPAKAKAIVAYRKKNGEFKALEDLKNVKGFKKMNDDQLKEIEDQLTLG